MNRSAAIGSLSFRRLYSGAASQIRFAVGSRSAGVWRNLIPAEMVLARNMAQTIRTELGTMSDMTGSGPSNALVQPQAHYHHCGEAASEKCLSAATFVR